MEIRLEKCAMLIIISGKRQITEGIELPKQERIRSLREKENHEYLGILEADSIRQVKMKFKKMRKEYLRRTRTLSETKLCRRNLIKGVNIWAVPIVRYWEPFLKWMRDKHQQTDQRTRKLMKVHKSLHPRDDIMFVKKKGRKRTRQH